MATKKEFIERMSPFLIAMLVIEGLGGFLGLVDGQLLMLLAFMTSLLLAFSLSTSPRAFILITCLPKNVPHCTRLNYS